MQILAASATIASKLSASPVDHWHEKHFGVIGYRRDGSPIFGMTWKPVSSQRAANLLAHGLPDFIRLGRDEFDADAARRAITAEVYA